MRVQSVHSSFETEVMEMHERLLCALVRYDAMYFASLSVCASHLNQTQCSTADRVLHYTAVLTLLTVQYVAELTALATAMT
jgi:hypothetical protein